MPSLLLPVASWEPVPLCSQEGAVPQSGLGVRRGGAFVLWLLRVVLSLPLISQGLNLEVTEGHRVCFLFQ